MKRFKNIIFIFDPTTEQQVTVERVISLTKDNDAHLTVFSAINTFPDNRNFISTVMPPHDLLSLVIAEHQEKIDHLVTIMEQKGIDVSAKIMTGTPFVEIIRQVLREKHDLVVVTAENMSELEDSFFGSTAMHLMRKCPCPVWVVKQSQNTKYAHVLAAVDVSVDAEDANQDALNPLILQLASSMAQQEKSEFHVVQVWSLFGEIYMEIRGALSKESIQNANKQIRHQYSNRLEQLIASIDLKDLKVQKHLLKNDDIATTIIDLTKSIEIDLLVMGTVCRTGITGFFIGNTAEKVLSEVNCSVLTVKPDNFISPIKLEEI